MLLAVFITLALASTNGGHKITTFPIFNECITIANLTNALETTITLGENICADYFRAIGNSTKEVMLNPLIDVTFSDTSTFSSYSDELNIINVHLEQLLSQFVPEGDCNLQVEKALLCSEIFLPCHHVYAGDQWNYGSYMCRESCEYLSSCTYNNNCYLYPRYNPDSPTHCAIVSDKIFQLYDLPTTTADSALASAMVLTLFV